jgi:hypothetical protein
MVRVKDAITDYQVTLRRLSGVGFQKSSMFVTSERREPTSDLPPKDLLLGQVCALTIFAFTTSCTLIGHILKVIEPGREAEAKILSRLSIVQKQLRRWHAPCLPMTHLKVWRHKFT